MIRQFMPHIRARILALIAVPFYLFFFRNARKGKNGKVDALSPRILVVPQLTRIGDFLCTTPVFAAIKKRYPECFLSVMVTKRTAPLALHNPDIDHLLFYEDCEYSDVFGLSRLFKKTREQEYDWLVNVAASSFGSFLAVYGRIPHQSKIIRRERPFTEMVTDWMNEHTVVYTDGEHLPTLYLRALAPLGIPTPKPHEIQKTLNVDVGADRRAQKFLRERALVPGDLVVGMSVSAGNPIKEWGFHKFGELARILIATYNAKIVFVGSPRERGKMEAVNKEIEGAGIVVPPESIIDLAAIMKYFSVFIASDTGPIHIADALGIPLIDIVGPVDPYEQTPQGETSIVVKPPGDIKPTVFAFRPEGSREESRRAAEATTVDEVYDAFRRLYAMISK